MVKKYGDLYLQARRALLPTEGENAAAAARELLAFASGKSVAAVLADANLYASEQIEADLNGYVNRMLAHEPLPYILGQWDFYGISLEVTPDVLIPRDDTMAVTDLALEVLRTGHPSPRVLDLCCGRDRHRPRREKARAVLCRHARRAGMQSAVCDRGGDDPAGALGP